VRENTARFRRKDGSLAYGVRYRVCPNPIWEGFSVSDVSTRIRDFITSEIMFEDSSASLTDETPLLGSVMDSLGLMQLVAFLEEEFDVEIDDSDVTVDNFRTVGDIENLIGQKAQVG
jgi:acyl carrier protein